MLADYNIYGGKMSVESEHIVAMVEHDLAAVSGIHVSYGHVAIGSGTHRRADGRVNIDALVEGAFAVDRILTLTEAGAHAALQRPKRGRVGQLRPVAGKVGREAALEGAGYPAAHGLRPQYIKLVDGELHLLRVYIVCQAQAGGRGLGRGDGCSLRLGRSQLVLPQSVERGHFICQG